MILGRGYARITSPCSEPVCVAVEDGCVCGVQAECDTPSGRVGHGAAGAVTVPTGQTAYEIRNGVYGPRALPVIAATVSSSCTFGNGDLVLRTLAELENPIRVATMTMLLWPDTTLTQRPHQLRMGDAVELDVAGFADFHAVVAGLAWRLSADNIPEIEVVALGDTTASAASAVADRQHQRHVGRRPDGYFDVDRSWRVVG